MRGLHYFFTLLLASLLAVGCTLDTGGVSASSLYEAPPGVLPLASIDTAEWEVAPAGCEDRIPENVTFEIARGANGLLVAVNDQGDAVCTDTYEAIQEELEDKGRGDDADDLEASISVTLGYNTPGDEAEDVGFDPTADDPSPQPSRPAMEMPDDPSRDDPSPQPS